MKYWLHTTRVVFVYRKQNVAISNLCVRDLILLDLNIPHMETTI